MLNSCLQEYDTRSSSGLRMSFALAMAAGGIWMTSFPSSGKMFSYEDQVERRMGRCRAQ